MKTNRPIIASFMVSLAAFITAEAAVPSKPKSAVPADYAALAKQFDYDRTKPLDIKDDGVEERSGYTIHEITYASPVSGRVPAFLLIPETPGPHPAILFGHWGEGNHREFLAEAGIYARAGVICLLPAYPWVRPQPWLRSVGNWDKPELDKEVYRQAVLDLRRGIDVLFARTDVDQARLGYIGHSYGAQWGSILTAVDRRMQATVLMTGTPDLDCIFLREDAPAPLKEFIKSLPPGQFEKYLSVQSALSAEKYVGHAAPIPLFFQFGSADHNFGRDAMERYFAAAGQPKKILWYNAGHSLADPQAAMDRYAFLAGPLKLGPRPQ
jgi:dienelactone hydrolase